MISGGGSMSHSRRGFPTDLDARSVGGESVMSRRSRRDRGDDPAKNFKVVIRVRPPLPRETEEDKEFRNVVKVDESERVLTISENLAAIEDGSATPGGPYSTHVFTFDHVYDQHATQKKVYDTTAKAVVESALQGYNATIFAYGQTGTGKTYTMEGFNSAEERGIIPRAIEQIFQHIQSSVSPRMRFLVRASYLQIYNEVISDLLKPERSNLAIREDKKKGVFVEGLSEWVVRSPQEIYGLMERGGEKRATGSTKMNEMSSRSHAVFIIIAEQSETKYVDERGQDLSPAEFHQLLKSHGGLGEGAMTKLETHVRQSFKVGKLNLVDLAGSERVRLTGATGQRLEESKKINQSLSALGNVIAALTDARGRQHIPYRDSKLTRILEDSLGGNCKTTMMAMTSPALEAFTESLSTLKFANRAKNIKNEARVNEDLDQKSLLRKYERELKRLRAELEQRSRNVVDKRRLLELDEQRRRAEEDKMAAIRALEARSLEMMREKAEKRKLEERIHMLTSQMLVGNPGSEQRGGADGQVEETPQFRAALKEHQERIRVEYDRKVADLERERETMEEEKAQVDRYKQLLLKQRDIMIALTTRLNERDEQIMALQDELDAYDKHQKELEEKLDERTAALFHLQRVVMEYQQVSPVKHAELSEALGDWAGKRGGDGPPRTPGGGAGLPHVSPTMMITHKQYRPYGQGRADVVVYGAGGDGGAGSGAGAGTGGDAGNGTGAGGGSSGLLSAEEKIRELDRILAARKHEHERLARELEEVQAEKVSMEYLLRERLEKLVQSEIEARMAAYREGGEGGDASRLRRDLAAANEEIARLRATAGSGSGGGVAGGGGAEGGEAQRMARQHAAFRAEATARLQERDRAVDAAKSALEASEKRRRDAENEVARLRRSGGGGGGGDTAVRQRLTTLEKERQAIQTIIESKIKTLVDKVGDAATPVLRHATPGDSARFTRELQALQRLVTMAISALHHAEGSR